MLRLGRYTAYRPIERIGMYGIGRLTTKLRKVAQSIPFSILLCETLRYFVVDILLNLLTLDYNIH
jgi:hypothetical protein